MGERFAVELDRWVLGSEGFAPFWGEDDTDDDEENDDDEHHNT